MIIDQLAALSVPGPTITTVSAPFWTAAANNILSIQRCRACARHVFYPRALCPHCWSDHLEWVEASGNAKLRSWSVVHKPGHPAWQSATPYALGLVELAEGPVMLTHLLVDPNHLRMDMDLHVRFVPVSGTVLPMFEAAQ